MTHIAQWLADLGLGQYAEPFEANDIDAAVLADLTDQDLKDIGVASVGHRRRLMVAIAALSGAAAPPAPGPADAAAAATRPADAAERRQVSVMFCDLVDSTMLSGNVDPEDLRDIISAYQAACARVIKSYDGFLAKYMGDGILAYFGYPLAHEDAAERAAHAGLEIVEQLKTLHTEASPMLRVRIGIATGLVVVGDIIGEGAAQEAAIIGQTPNLAARLQALAAPGTVLVSSETRRLLGGVFSLQTLGEHELKGFAKPVEAWQVTGQRRAESRFEAAHASRLDDFIGREGEIGGLLGAFERASSGDGQVVLIAGEAGIGKSRLVAQFTELIGEQPVRVRYQCSPHHRESPLYPVIQQLNNAFDFQPGDSDEARLDKLETGLRLATQRVEETAPLFASLLLVAPGKRYPALSVSSAQQRRQTMAAILDQMEGLARQAPLLVVCEDVHWADATTLELLDLAIERLKQLRVLMLLTFRPDFEPPWIGLKNVSSVALARLRREDIERIATQVVGGRSLPAEVMSQIVAKTDGVPLFVEELTKTVAESGVLITEGDHYRLDGALPPLAIPSTLQDSLMARLDRLAPLREIVQYAAAIGREFSRSLLLAAAGCDAAMLDSALTQLEASELVFRAAHADAEPRFVFKHALVQDVAYDSLLRQRRQTIHRRIAEVIIERFAELAALQPEVVAHHLSQGGLGRQAVEWWGRAGESALRRAAFAEALTHFQRATELADRDPDPSPEGVVARLRLQIAYGQALLSARGYSASETAAAFSRARDLARSIEDPAARIPIYYGLWAGSYVRSELETMREMADLIMLDAAKLQGAPELHLAHRILGVNYHLQGDYVRAAPHLELAVDGYEHERDAELAFRFGQDVGVAAMIFLAAVLWPLGETERGEAVLEEALALAQRSGQPTSLVIALFVKWQYADWRGDKAEGVSWARALIALARDHGMQMWRAFGAFLDGWANWVEAAEPEEEAIAQMHRGIAECRAQGIAFYVPLLRTIIARAELAAGRQAGALAILDDVIAETTQSGQLVRGAETMLARAETLAADPQAVDAECEQAFLDAVAVAEAQATKVFRLRASVSLARYYRARHRAADAAAALERGLEGCPATLPEVVEARHALDGLRDERKSAGKRAAPRSKAASTSG